MARFSLSYLHREVSLAPGLHAIDRHPACTISLDDPKVSRRHARIIVTDDEAFVEDLGSRHGVLVDGRRIDGCQRLSDRSRLQIGDQVLTLVNAHSPRARALAAKELSPYDELVCRVDSLRVLGAWAQHELSAGRVDEAGRILGARLTQILEVARKAPEAMPDVVVAQAIQYATWLVTAGVKSWGTYAFDLRMAKLRAPPFAGGFELVSPTLGVVDLCSLGDYLANLPTTDAPPGQAGQADPDDGPG